MKTETEKRGRGRPKKYEIEPINATAQELARAIFQVTETPGTGGEDQEKDDAENPIPV